jgi:hypothetical protein
MPWGPRVFGCPLRRWDPNTYGYHGDDGRKYQGTAKGEEYGPTFGSGDTIGACINMARQEVFFTKNGVKLKPAFRNVRGTLFPVVALHRWATKGDRML